MPKNVIDATRWLRPDGSQHGLRTQIFESGDSRGTPTRISRVEFPGTLSTHILSPQHINLEEAAALLRFVRWVLRSHHRFNRRLVVLLDS